MHASFHGQVWKGNWSKLLHSIMHLGNRKGNWTRKKRQREQLRSRMEEELRSCTSPVPEDSASNLPSGVTGISSIQSKVELAALGAERASRDVSSSEDQRKQCMLTQTIMDLMREIRDPNVPDPFKSFLIQLLEYNQTKLTAMQDSSPTKAARAANDQEHLLSSSSGSSQSGPQVASAAQAPGT